MSNRSGPDLDLNCLQRSSAEDLIFYENQDNSLEISGLIFNKNRPNYKTYLIYQANCQLAENLHKI